MEENRTETLWLEPGRAPAGEVVVQLANFLAPRALSPSGAPLGWAARRDDLVLGSGTLEDVWDVLSWSGLGEEALLAPLRVSELSDGTLDFEGATRATLVPLGPVSSSLRELCSAATALWIDELDPLVQVRVATWSLLWSASPDHFARQECVSDRDFLTVGLEAALATAASSGDVDLEISAFADVVKMARLPDALATRLVDALLVRLDDDDDRGAHVAITGVNEALRTLLAQPAASRTRFLDLLERHPHLSVSETRAAVRATARADQAHALAGVDVWSLSPSADLELGADFELSVLVRAASELTPEQLARLEDSWSTSNPLTRDAQDLLDAAAVS